MELVWDGKYKDGKRVAPVKIALPFQTIETVNESVQERQRTLDFFSSGRDSEWRNRLIWGDKKYVLPSLLDEFAGKVNLIYIDPPFATGADFSFTATIPDDPDTPGDQGATFVKQPSILEQKAYRDTWGKGLDSYFQWFYETVSVLYGLLTEDGSIYVHCDPNVGSGVRFILDEVFSPTGFRNEISWKRQSAHNDSSKYGAVHDIIYFYSKSNKWIWNEVLAEPSPDYIEGFFDQVEAETGRRYARGDLSAGGLSGGGYDYEYKGVRRVWRLPLSTMERHDSEGRLHWPKKGVPRLKRYLDEFKGVPAQDFWNDIRVIHNQAQERVGYPTQKPEALLERIIKASSNEGDLVLDCFCGSGTTAAVAEKLGRRWITCDLGRFAVHTARKRLLSISGVNPFVVQNLGKYERQAWQKLEFAPSEDAQVREARYRHFILDLYSADAISSGMWLHGIKLGRMVHVGAVDAPVTLSDVKAIATETWHRVGSGDEAPEEAGVDILGWDFAFELNELGRQVAKDAGIDVRFRKIPREVLEKKAVDQGDIRFFELAALSVTAEAGPRRGLELTLKDFIIAPDDVPQEVMSAVTHWSQLIDYWAIDWDFKGDTFHNQWQAYRTKKNTKLERKASYSYDVPGRYTVLVKVIDLLGNDTTKALEVEIA